MIGRGRRRRRRKGEGRRRKRRWERNIGRRGEYSIRCNIIYNNSIIMYNIIRIIIYV